ncbi:trypsin-like peptidase domain-containing protein [Bacillus sp. AGMB 02131]|uniref:Trypsin-like peptidase domain-containing protein n=1 Tax=Peribacillus faecalis TaxID=2772559 RepID=A0A927CYH4_9BACI|nr:trypsin-like peptidase domain-containing protein [Peribacillus faecalis]MBD3110008.1 trypsin-like peptidase domain-containing protein [Peribacillus faecalis]
MGYYDQDYNSRESRKKESKKGYFWSGFIGAVIGALLFSLIFPLVTSNNQKSTTNNSEGTPAKIEQGISLDVDTAVTGAYDIAADAVVGITNIQEASIFSASGEAGTGSGVVYKKDNGKAYIVTNHHVIEGASTIEVTLADGTKKNAELLGSDVWTDLAVLEIEATDISTIAEFGDSDSLKPGEPIMAIGNPLGLQFSGSVTKGIISGLERTIEIDINEDGIIDWNAEVIQTDAAINPGNSGGALVNVLGQVVGINSMKIAEQAVEGIGLAIPINSVIPIIEDIEQYGEVKRPYLGVSLVPISQITQFHRESTLKLPKDVTEGVAIMEVEPASSADEAGIQKYDVIVKMDGEEITDLASFRTHLYEEKEIGDELEVTIYRDGKLQTITMKLQSQTF